MSLKIRLRKQGRTNSPFFRLVVTNTLSPRDGKYIETLGWYNPGEAELEKNLLIKGDRVRYWFTKGAQLSENVENLMKKGAPEVMKEITGMETAKKAKKLAKRKQRRQKKTS
ncbi:30S ribosomal protein S16 [Chlamydiales bacterium SCGC AB-751-O23]|jgi:small subunit ribosomal protein S16|nr:30S ribosomal protein S16 [Chlamydiales bacterium SCGC AB-751-O23]